MPNGLSWLHIVRGDVGVETIRDAGCKCRVALRAQRAVHENGHARQFAGAGQFVQHINDLLGAPDGKGGDDDLAAARTFRPRACRPGRRRPGAAWTARGIGGFDLEVIHVLDGQGVAQNSSPPRPTSPLNRRGISAPFP